MDKTKLKVLLIVPDHFLVIGILAQYIVKACPDIDFYFLAERDIHIRKEEFRHYLKHIDVLHFLSNMSTANIPKEIDLSALPCPLVTTIHHIEPGEERKISMAEVGDVIHVIAQEWENLLKGKTQKPVYLAHQPIDLERFHPNCNVMRPRTPFRIGWFGMSGALDNRKRLDILLEAMSQLRSQNIAFELVVRGSIWNKLSDFFKEKGIKLRNLGYVSFDDLSAGYREIDLYVCTSDMEGGPLTLLEALASGVPVVSTPVGQVPDILQSGGGIMVEKNNPAAVAEGVRKIILHRELYHQLCLDAQKTAESYSGVKMTQEYISLYQGAIRQYEIKSHQRWMSPDPLEIEPLRQREIELANASLREARRQKQKGFLLQGLSTAIKATGSRDISFRMKIRELLYFLR